MSEIDTYQHECIGIVACPSDYEIMAGNNMHRGVPLYFLKEDALTATSYQAKKGDLLLGGGSGESAALRISVPEALTFFAHKQQDSSGLSAEPVKAYWNMNQAYVFCSGYAKLGWMPHDRIEYWLAKHVLAFVLNTRPELFDKENMKVSIKGYGSICRLPTTEEKQLW